MSLSLLRFLRLHFDIFHEPTSLFTVRENPTERSFVCFVTLVTVKLLLLATSQAFSFSNIFILKFFIGNHDVCNIILRLKSASSAS